MTCNVSPFNDSVLLYVSPPLSINMSTGLPLYLAEGKPPSQSVGNDQYSGRSQASRKLAKRVPPSLALITIVGQPPVLESVFRQMPTKLSIGGNIGVPVALGAKVGVGVSVGVSVGGIGVFVGKGVDVGGTGVEAGAHPVDKTVSTTNAKNTD